MPPIRPVPAGTSAVRANAAVSAPELARRLGVSPRRRGVAALAGALRRPPRRRVTSTTAARGPPRPRRDTLCRRVGAAGLATGPGPQSTHDHRAAREDD